MTELQVILIVSAFSIVIVWGISQWWDKVFYKKYWDTREALDNKELQRHEERCRIMRVIEQEYGIKPKGKK